MSATIDNLIEEIRILEKQTAVENFIQENDNNLREILKRKKAQLNDAISLQNNSNLLKG